jgi:hypothetical protein
LREVLAGPVAELEQAIWLLGSELGTEVQSALDAARALAGSLEDTDPGASARVQSDFVATRVALVLLGISGIG